MKKFILIFLCIYFGFQCPLSAEEKIPFTGEVTVKILNVRAGYNINFEIIQSLNIGDKVVVLDKKFGWYKIKLSADANCYINAKYVEKQSNLQGMATGENVNVRVRPDIKSSILCQVSSGDNLKVIKSYGNEWYEIQAPDNCYGWVSDKYVKYYSILKQYQGENESAKAIEQEQNAAVSETALDDGSVKQSEKSEFSFQQTGTLRRLTSFFPHPATHELTQNGKTLCYLAGDKARLNSVVNLKVKISGSIQKELNYSHPVVLVEEIKIIE